MVPPFQETSICVLSTSFTRAQSPPSLRPSFAQEELLFGGRGRGEQKLSELDKKLTRKDRNSGISDMMLRKSHRLCPMIVGNLTVHSTRRGWQQLYVWWCWQQASKKLEAQMVYPKQFQCKGLFQCWNVIFLSHDIHIFYHHIHAALRLGPPAPTWFMLVRQ